MDPYTADDLLTRIGVTPGAPPEQELKDFVKPLSSVCSIRDVATGIESFYIMKCRVCAANDIVPNEKDELFSVLWYMAAWEQHVSTHQDVMGVLRRRQLPIVGQEATLLLAGTKVRNGHRGWYDRIRQGQVNGLTEVINARMAANFELERQTMPVLTITSSTQTTTTSISTTTSSTQTSTLPRINSFNATERITIAIIVIMLVVFAIIWLWKIISGVIAVTQEAEEYSKRFRCMERAYVYAEEICDLSLNIQSIINLL